MKLKKQHPGQVALIMVLIMTVMSAIAVSLASRSTVETRIQLMNVESTEALLTAQSGLEQSIAKGTPLSGTLADGKQYQVSLSDTGTGSVTSEKVSPGETFEVNLEGMTGVTGIKIYWKAVIAGGTPAIFVSDVRTTQTLDYAYDTDGTGGFTKVTAGGVLNGVSYAYTTPTPITVVAGSSQKLRIAVLGSAAFLGIEPVGGQLPTQFTNFRSVADVSSTTQTVVKYGIEYLESKTDQLPAVFDYVLFSGGSISQ